MLRGWGWLDRTWRRIDPRKRVPAVLCAPLALAGAAATLLALAGGAIYRGIVADSPELAKVMVSVHGPALMAVLRIAAALLGPGMLACAVLGFRRRVWTPRLLRWAYMGFYGLVALYGVVVVSAINVVGDRRVAIQGAVPDPVEIFHLKWSFLWPATLGAFLVGLAHMYSRRPTAVAVYTGRAVAETDEDLMIGGAGRRPLYRRSMWKSLLWHVLILIVIPSLLQGIACAPPYLIPGGGGGGGSPPRQVQQAMKIKKKQPKKKLTYIARMNAAIFLYVPTLDDSTVKKEVEEMTQVTHVAQGMTVGLGEGAGGGMGRGHGKGGFPGGDKLGRIQFIRIQYNGDGWDDGLDDRGGADVNFLRELKRVSNLPVGVRGEAESIRTITSRKKGFQPPFVFMTGERGISVPPADIKLLRQYLLDGGMIFADCGSKTWGADFRKFVQQLFPDRHMVDIPDDDPIFKMPYVFPEGAPAFWHHDGYRARGLKINGRWAVFYHPGDLNDAWKTGHSGMDPELADRAFQMGVNVIYYAIVNYIEVARKHAKP